MAVRVARSSESFDLRKKVLRLETLYDVSRALNVLRDEQALVDEIVARAVALLDAERGFGVVFEEQSGPAVVSTVSFPTFPGSLAAASDPFVLDLCRARGPLSRTEETVLGSAAGSVVGAPLVVRDRVLGVLVALEREARGGGRRRSTTATGASSSRSRPWRRRRSTPSASCAPSRPTWIGFGRRTAP